MTRRKRLGKGLEALLNATGTETAAPATIPMQESEPADTSSSISDVAHLPIAIITENPFQPRREFNESEIASLAASLTSHDMLQPVLVRPTESGYELISGERRLRAAKRAGWSKIPARIREADDRLVAELAIVENLQRKDLNPIEKALSFRRYIDQHGCTQEDLAKRIEIDRSTVTNLMRLLELPTLVQDALRNGALTAGHARALLPLGDEKLQIEFCNKIQNETISVRQTEQMVSDYITKADTPTVKVKRKTNDQIEALQQDLKMTLGTKVDIRATKRGSGRIVIHFQNPNEFERIRAILKTQNQRKSAG